MTQPNYAEVERSIRNKVCLRHPDLFLVVQHNGTAYVPQCNGCVREGLTPVFGEAPGKLLERTKNMATSTTLATRDQRLANLKVQDVKTLLQMGKATDPEITAFILYCKAVDADPWAKEIYLVKYSERDPAAIVLALNWYLKRASHNPLYESYESGVIVQRQGRYFDEVGSVVHPGDVLYGGWCRVYKKGARVPFERRVTMQEYDRHQFNWTKTPATMIEKVAIVQCIRRGFPDEFGEAEADRAVVLEGEVEAPFPSGKGVIAPPGETFCERHQTPMIWNQYKHRNGHVLDGEIGPKGGKVWCYGEPAVADPSALSEHAQEGPSETQEAASDTSQEESAGGEPRKPFENIGEVFDWGKTVLGYKNTAEMWQASGWHGMSEVTTLDELADRLEAKSPLQPKAS